MRAGDYFYLVYYSNNKSAAVLFHRHGHDVGRLSVMVVGIGSIGIGVVDTICGSVAGGRRWSSLLCADGQTQLKLTLDSEFVCLSSTRRMEYI